MSPCEPSDQFGEELGKDSAGEEEKEDGDEHHDQTVDHESPEGRCRVVVDQVDVFCHDVLLVVVVKVVVVLVVLL